jgi:hypothetical protein
MLHFSMSELPPATIYPLITRRECTKAPGKTKDPYKRGLKVEATHRVASLYARKAV